MSNKRLVRNSMYSGKKEDRNGRRIAVVPTTKKDLSSVAIDYYKQQRRRTGEYRHEHMLAAKNFKKPAMPIKEDLAKKLAMVKFRNMTFSHLNRKGV